MYPAIQAIPTFGTFQGVTVAMVGINRLRPNIPPSRTIRMIWTNRIAPVVGVVGR
jgi:hypothetical protein